MKTILFAIAVMLSATVGAAPRQVPQQVIEHPTGCFWKDNGGRCMVFNTTVKTLKCDVHSKMTVKDHNGERTSVGVRKVDVPPKMDTEFSVQPNPGEKLERVEIRAICK